MLLYQPSPGIGFQPPAVLCFRKPVNLIHACTSLLASPGGQTHGSQAAGSGCVLGWKPPNVNVCQSQLPVSLQSWAGNTGAMRSRSANLCSSLGSGLSLSQII